MAIKVGGTTVIDDSRALSNIASVDATTVAALGAAGVGAGGGVIELPAGETISAGDFVEVQSSGSAFKIKETSTPRSTADNSSYGGEYIYSSGSAGVTIRPHVVSSSATYDPIVVFQDRNARAHWTLHPVTSADPVQGIDVGRSLGSYNLGGGGPVSIYDAHNNVVVGIWCVYESDAVDWCEAAVCTPNAAGTDITIGSSVRWLDGFRSDQFDAVYGSGGVFFITYQSDGGGSYVIAGSVSGTTITYGSPVQWDSTKRNSLAFYDSTNSQLGIVTSNGKTYFFSHSGTTLTAKSYSSSNEWNGGNAVSPRGVIFDPDTDTVILNYQLDQSPGGTWVRAGSVTNNSISWGTAQQLETNSTFSVYSSFALLADGRIAVSISSESVNVMRLFLLSLSGTTITVPAYEQQSNGKNASGLIEHPDNGLLYLTGRSSDSSFIYGYETTIVTSNADNSIGIASENIASGSTGDILVIGNKYSGYSGLTPGTTYYLNDDGTISTSGVAARLIGRAVSATTLLIEG
jgi:hypothetical protein